MSTQSYSDQTMIKIPLAALRCLLTYPKDNKIICEIDTKSLKATNPPKTLDEIINDARIGYELGNYKTFTKSKDLISYLRS